MQVGKPTHLTLAVSDEATSSSATTYATTVFTRLLANWAQDLLLHNKQQELQSATYEVSSREPGILDKAA
jgi:hypothetical protein